MKSTSRPEPPHAKVRPRKHTLPGSLRIMMYRRSASSVSVFVSVLCGQYFALHGFREATTLLSSNG